MRAVVAHLGALAVHEVDEPVPGPGQVLLDVARCGICGSDLHALAHADEQADALAEVGYGGAMRSDQRVVLGHEFVGTVAAYGSKTRRTVPLGAPVVALPLRRTAAGFDAIGISAAAPGGYAERVVVEESLALPVPAGLDLAEAALTEPLAIGWHAVRKSELGRRDVAVVVGCGPVGLAIIAVLKARGVRTVVAVDPAAVRRDIARRCGADEVLDPADGSPYQGRGFLPTVPAAVELGVTTLERLQKLPVPWHGVWRTLDRLGVRPKRPVVFECVGVPGMIDAIVTAAPLYSRVVVVGVCMTADTFRPVIAINKELDLRFAVGYTPLEFRDTLHSLARGRLQVAPMLTGTVSLDQVAATFEALARPSDQAKVLIDPARSGS